jgi:hypothetical protein
LREAEVPLGEREIDIYKDALNYIASDTVTTAVRASITINGGHVIRANVNADNGIMHVLDKVLILTEMSNVLPGKSTTHSSNLCKNSP